MSQTNFVNWKQFDPARLSIEKPESKPWENKAENKKGSYLKAKIMYLYDAPNGTMIKDTLYFEHCPSFFEGLTTSDNNGKKETQTQARYDISKVETRQFLEVCDKIYNRLIDLVIPLKDDFNSKEFNKATAKALMKHIIYRPVDTITGETDPNKNASQYHKVYTFGKSQTLFISLKKEKCGYDLLKTAQFHGIPLISYDTLYSGGNGKISIQSHMSSCVITSKLETLGSNNRQMVTADEQSKIDPNMVEQQVESIKDLSELMKSMQSVSMGSATKSGPSGPPVDNSAPLGENPVNLGSNHPGGMLAPSNTSVSSGPSNSPYQQASPIQQYQQAPQSFPTQQYQQMQQAPQSLQSPQTQQHMGIVGPAGPISSTGPSVSSPAQFAPVYSNGQPALNNLPPGFVMPSNIAGLMAGNGNK
jgi:hypothetical protein